MNNVESLTDFMFEEMERMNDIDLDDGDAQMERLEAEIKRAKAMGNVAKVIVSAGRAALDAERFKADFAGIPGMPVKVPKMLSD